MKLSFLLCLFAVLNLYAADSYSQTARISLSMRNAKVEDVLDKIEEQSEFFFLFNQKLIDVSRRVDINVSDMAIGDVLNRLFDPTKVECVVRDRQIIVTPVELAQSIVQQGIAVTGTVTDASGSPLPGATVQVKGTATGAVTDANGKYTITVPDEAAVLSFSFVGYTTVEETVGSRRNIDVTLSEGAQDLEEVVVIGYGSQKKSDITGALVNVNAATIAQAPVGNIAAALQGVAAGVDVQMAGGNTHPSAVPQIRIRGERSINAGNDVLIVVDGLPFSGSLNDISTDDIASVSILKDASATAIYGSRGANGVVLITTKRGTSGGLKVTYSGYYGLVNAIDMFPMMNSEQYIRMRQWAEYNSSGVGAFEGPDDPDLMAIGLVFGSSTEQEDYESGRYTNWQDLVYSHGAQTNHQLALSGGTERTTYNASIGYYNAQNAYELNDFNRITAKLSFDSKVNSWLKIGLQSLNTFSNTKGSTFNPMNQALLAKPYGKVYNDDNTLTTSISGSSSVWNPLLDLVDGAIVDNQRTLSTFTTGYADVMLPFGFKYRFNGGVMLRHGNTGRFYGVNTTQQRGGDNYAYSANGWNSDYTLENIVTWDKTLWEKHKFGITGLFSYEENQSESQNIVTGGYVDENVQYYNPSLSTKTPPITGDGSFSKWALMSWMGRLNYNYDDRYMFTATIRRDGSSRLAEGNKWHDFPSLAVAWNIAHESFMKNVKLLSALKLRASWGNVGNTAISPYQTMSYLSDNKYILGTENVIGYFPNSVPDVRLGWENTETVNFGLDFGLLKNRITGTIEVYQQNTTDLLLSVTLPRTSGFSGTYMTNIGATRNRGIEVNITTRNMAGDGHNSLQWTTDWTIFANRNTVMDLGEGVERVTGNGLFVGEDRNVIYSLEKDGLWQDTEADRAAMLQFGWDTDDEIRANVGTIRVVNHKIDYEDDGVTPKAIQSITDDDRTFIGRRAPNFEGGINNRLAWKGFDLSFLLSYKAGGIITSNMHNSGMNDLGGHNANNLNVDYWRPDNTTARWPKPLHNGNLTNRDLLARYNGSYVKLRNMSLGYSLPSSVLSKINISAARVYITGSNLYTWFSSEARNDGVIDPETTSTLNLVTPPVRTFLFGLNLTF